MKKNKKKIKCKKKIFEKIGKKSEKIRKNQKKSEKIGRNQKKRESEIIRKLINNTCIHVYMTYWQYLIKVGRRKKKIERR